MKQETLLQIANRKLMSNDWLNGAEFGAKWQQEQDNKMYSEEEFLSFGKSCFYKGFEKSEKDDANCYTAFREEIGSIIEQFKNKKL